MTTPHPAPSTSTTTPSTSQPTNQSLSPLEQDVLAEYKRLLSNLNTVSPAPVLFSPVAHPLTFPPTSPSSNCLILSTIAIYPPLRPLREPYSRRPRLAEDAGAENESGEHVAESERLQHRAAAGGLCWRGGWGWWGGLRGERTVQEGKREGMWIGGIRVQDGKEEGGW